MSLDVGKKELLKGNLDLVKAFGFDFDDSLRLVKVPRMDRVVLGKDDLDEILYILAEEGKLVASNYQFSRIRAMLASKAW